MRNIGSCLCSNSSKLQPSVARGETFSMSREGRTRPKRHLLYDPSCECGAAICSCDSRSSSYGNLLSRSGSTRTAVMTDTITYRTTVSTGSFLSHLSVWNVWNTLFLTRMRSLLRPRTFCYTRLRVRTFCPRFCPLV